MRTAADILENNKHDIICVAPDATLHDALQIMVSNKLGAMVVKDGEEFVGIWTERDLMSNVLAEGFNIKTEKISDHMHTSLKCAEASDTVYDLMDKLLGLRIRHLMIKENDSIIGMVSIGDVIKAALQEKTQEIKQLNALVSWEYYEEWKARTAE